MLSLTILSLALTVVGVVPPALTVQSVTFLGFSRTEAAYAWRIDFRRSTPAGNGQSDQFSLIELRDTEHGAAVAMFQSGALRRQDASGRPLATPATQLQAANPEWRQATPAAIWGRLLKRGGFHSQRHAFTDTMVRLLPDSDAPLKATAAHKEARLVGDAGQPLGFTPMVRTLEGHQLPLGHFRHEADPGTVLTAEIQIFHSHSGRLIAVVNRFVPESGGLPTVQTLVVNTGRDPVASTILHPLRLVDWQAHSLRDSFQKIHPQGMQHFDAFVGTLF